VQDPFDTFQLPFELRRLLPEHEQGTLKDKILEIHVRLKKRDPELEDNRGRGLHLWLLFDAIAIRLQHQPNFKENLVENVIPEFIEQIRSDLSWYPHNHDGDLRTYFLDPCIIQWRNARLVAHPRPRRNQRYRTIDKVLQEIAGSRPRTQKEVFRSLDERCGVIPPAEPFAMARGWMAGFQRDSAAARAWLSKRWAELKLPPLPRGPKAPRE
jgi:hypothetical protein